MYGAGVHAGQNEYLQPLIDGGKIRAACETAIGEGNPVSAQSFAQECQRGYGWDRTRIDSTEGAKIWSATVSWRTTWSRSAPCQREGRGSGGLAPNPIARYRPGVREMVAGRPARPRTPGFED